MIAEFRRAVEPIGLYSTSGGALPIAPLNIRTNPPQSTVFVDNIAVGQSRDDGWITLNGIQSGNHYLRVSHDGFEDWQGDINCDGRPQQVLAELRSGTGKIPKPPAATVAFNSGSHHNTPHSFSSTQGNEGHMLETAVQQWDTGDQGIAVQSMPPKKRFFSPLVLGAIALFGLFLLGGVAIGGAYMAGLFGGNRPAGGAGVNSSTPPPKTGLSPVGPIKAEMIQIPGGSFLMGRDDGDLKERPANNVDVGRFWMDKTEVTNGEYLEFVTETGYAPPKHWVNGKPLEGTEMVPVRYVALDDTEAFAKWRSKRDGFKYRLPTEQEWEYVARNGGKNTLYPWGNEWIDGVSIIGVTDSEPSAVGSKPQGKNEWGVVDLIGNVWEWTSSELKPYPGSNVVVEKKPGKRIVVRGGSAHEDPSKLKITSTFRVDVSADQKEKTIGFRLIRSE